MIHFISDAPLEKTVGISNAVVGWLELDLDQLDKGVKGEFEVDLRTFHTGVEPRNEQIKDQIFNASEFPVAKFSLGKLLKSSKPKLTTDAAVTLKVDGQLQARGLALPQPVVMNLKYFKESPATRQRLTGNLLKVSASLEVDTTNFGVSVTEEQKLRYARVLQVYADAIGTDRAPLKASAEEPLKLK